MKTLLLSGNSPPLSQNTAGGSVEPDLATVLFHSVEEERDELRLRQTELSHALKQLEAENTELRSTVSTLRDRTAEGQLKTAEEDSKVSKHAPCAHLHVYHVDRCKKNSHLVSGRKPISVPTICFSLSCFLFCDLWIIAGFLQVRENWKKSGEFEWSGKGQGKIFFLEKLGKSQRKSKS